MLSLALLLAIVAPLLAGLAVLAARLVRRLDREEDATAPAAVADLVPRGAAAEAVLPSLPVGFRYDAIAPGPLQLVDDDAPTTKVCPDCAETVLASARVCKHCRYRFAPPLHGSPAVDVR